MKRTSTKYATIAAFAMVLALFAMQTTQTQAGPFFGGYTKGVSGASLGSGR